MVASLGAFGRQPRRVGHQEPVAGVGPQRLAHAGIIADSPISDGLRQGGVIGQAQGFQAGEVGLQLGRSQLQLTPDDLQGVPPIVLLQGQVATDL